MCQIYNALDINRHIDGEIFLCFKQILFLVGVIRFYMLRIEDINYTQLSDYGILHKKNVSGDLYLKPILNIRSSCT